MTSEQFTYWLQGYFEIANTSELDRKQVEIIKDHLNLVFSKVTPDRNTEPVNPFPVWKEPYTDPNTFPNPLTITCDALVGKRGGKMC